VGQSKFGMQTFNQSLAAAVAKRLITMEEALNRFSDQDELKNLISSGHGTVRPGGPPPPPPAR
jgi:twitching motility protein PilT